MTQTVPQKKQIYRVLGVWLLVILAIRILNMLAGIAFIRDNLLVLTSVLLIYPPVILSLIQKKPITYWSLEAKKLRSSFILFLVVSVILLGLVLAANIFYQKIFFHVSYHSGHSQIWVSFIMTQYILVAFPEEFFFRGFLQEAFVKTWPAKNKIFGAPFGCAAVMMSGLFALSHSLISLKWWHAFIFFPALVFAWLKEKTGTIWAGVLFHGACNLFAYWVALHY